MAVADEIQNRNWFRVHTIEKPAIQHASIPIHSNALKAFLRDLAHVTAMEKAGKITRKLASLCIRYATISDVQIL